MSFILDLQNQYLEYAASLFNAELVDKQFANVMNSEEKVSRFRANIMTAFFRDSEVLINTMSGVLENRVVNFDKMYELAQTLRGCSSTIGAAKITAICGDFHQICKDNNAEMLKHCVQRLLQERSSLKNKIDSLFRLANQILTAGGGVPAFELKPEVCNLRNPGRV